MFNKNELILDKVRRASAFDIETAKQIMTIKSIEDPSLNCTAEGEEVVDAFGSTIDTIYRAKKGEFTGSNSLISFDLLAAQYGTDKVVAAQNDTISVPTYEILEIPTTGDDAGKVTLKYTPDKDIKYIYAYTAGDVGTAFTKGTEVSATAFVVSDKEITVPTGLTGKVFVEYSYASTEALKVVNKAENFPAEVMLKIYAYFKDVCNSNKIYSGAIIAPKAKLNPESVELALTSTGKHPFTFTIAKDYCDDEGELFTVIVANGDGAE
jgi:hypothetical protein